MHIIAFLPHCVCVGAGGGVKTSKKMYGSKIDTWAVEAEGDSDGSKPSQIMLLQIDGSRYCPTYSQFQKNGIKKLSRFTKKESNRFPCKTYYLFE
jgi:hypothetical protein